MKREDERQDVDGGGVRLRRVLARGVATALVAAVGATAARQGVCGTEGCAWLDWARADLVGSAAAAIDLALQGVFGARRRGRRSDDEDDGPGAAAPVTGRVRRGRALRPVSAKARGRAAKPVGAEALCGIGAADGAAASTEPATTSGRLGSADWVARVRRSVEG